MGLIGLFCFFQAALSLAGYRPDPIADAVLWAITGIWIFAVGWDVAKRMR